MNSIPLIKGNTPQEINTSIIALKKALSELEAQDRLLQGTDKDVQDKIKQINELIKGINIHLGTVDSHLTTIDGQITALQPVDTVTSGNMHSVTSNAVANNIVNSVASGNMKPVTSNAVASAMLLPKTLTSYYFYDHDTIKTPIPVNAGETEAIGYLLMYMGHTDAGDKTFVELYLIRVGYSGNNHTETLIASSGNVGSYHPTFGVSNDGYLTVYVPLKSRVCIY